MCSSAKAICSKDDEGVAVVGGRAGWETKRRRGGNVSKNSLAFRGSAWLEHRRPPMHTKSVMTPPHKLLEQGREVLRDEAELAGGMEFVVQVTFETKRSSALAETSKGEWKRTRRNNAGKRGLRSAKPKAT